MDQGVLRVQGKRKQEEEEKGEKFPRLARSFGSFSRIFTLPDNADECNIKVTFKAGILNLHAAKVAETNTNATEVKVD